MMNRAPALLTAIAVLLLSACGEAPPPAALPEALAANESNAAAQTQEVPSPPADLALSAAASQPAAPSVSLHELMRDVIGPNAQRVWRSVSYIATESGVQETMPVNDMDWDGLHQSVTILLEASHGLTLEGRDIGGAAYEAVRQNYQYTAAEIAERRARNLDDWNAIAVGMGDLARQIIAPIERRNILALTETGAALNQACETCHASYWLRP
ncbi:MAG: hypothetical protein LBF16_07400 [Pseudomonadales bacterium]|jgi:hypothetical protein|nr:hypothetical protein [Pseudomonadales bacterium]